MIYGDSLFLDNAVYLVKYSHSTIQVPLSLPGLNILVDDLANRSQRCRFGRYATFLKRVHPTEETVGKNLCEQEKKVFIKVCFKSKSWSVRSKRKEREKKQSRTRRKANYVQDRKKISISWIGSAWRFDSFLIFVNL